MKMRCPGKSVGAIIRDRAGRCLCLYYRKFPDRGLALIGGHIDENETPDQAVRREVLEETGLTILKMRLVLHSDIKNKCHRRDKKGNQFTLHEWWVYEITEWEGKPECREPGKHLFVRFLSVEEIEKYGREYRSDPNRYDFYSMWGYVLRRLKILQ